jgi:hypothetical protein
MLVFVQSNRVKLQWVLIVLREVAPLILRLESSSQLVSTLRLP